MAVFLISSAIVLALGFILFIFGLIKYVRRISKWPLIASVLLFILGFILALLGLMFD
ncbi:MAG TPA: hypothetical protein VFF28_05925 [Candidatus Nanoarchaeia archaeon]|nr:hypothetical protein [Candidatus Nanoarchaeia archaeon]